MEKPTLADKMSGASLPRNRRVLAGAKRPHGAVTQAKKIFDKLHAGRRRSK